MKLAVVIGQIVCTVRHPGLEHDKLLLVETINRQGEPSGECSVATDSIGAGNGEWVLVVGEAPHAVRNTVRHHPSI